MADIAVKGTVFSTDAVTGDVYFRTDTDMEQWYTYDGTQWYSVQVYESAGKLTFTTDSFQTYDGRIDAEKPIFIVDFETTSFVATNTGSDYWTYTGRSFTGAYTSGSNTTYTDAINTSSDAGGVFVDHSTDAVIAIDTITANKGMFGIYAAATGSPSNLLVIANTRYRKIVT